MIACPAQYARRGNPARPAKAELHRHLDGSVRLSTIAALARRHRLDLGVRSERELAERARVLTPLAGFEEVIARFRITQKVLCGYEAIRRVAFENVEDAWRDGVKLAELRFAPAFIAAERASATTRSSRRCWTAWSRQRGAAASKWP